MQRVTGPTPIWVCYIINGLAWVLFILNGNHIVEFVMGTACVYSGVVGIAKRDQTGAKNLIYVSFADAIWMYYWAFSAGDQSAGGIGGILNLLQTLGR
jgi:hypothetical protein